MLEPPENVTPKPAFVLRLMGYNPTRPNNTVPCPALPTSAGRAFSAVESSRPRGKPPMSQWMRSTTVKRQEALATGVSATGTEEEGGESTGRYFRIFSRYIGRRRFSGRTRECRKEVRDPSHPPDRDWGAGCGTPGQWRLLVSVRDRGGTQDQADVRDRVSGPG